ncbi:MAG: hypothetical protein M0036_12760 [Desulfobacteraceae bacterium]|nr:hypothetical protein [Desulfobacteraceae bacterium]
MKSFICRVFFRAVFCFSVGAALLASGAETRADPFQAGSLQFSLVAGSGRAFYNDYLVLGVGAGYFLMDGLEIGLDSEAWLGNDPNIYKLSPQVKYVLPIDAPIRPYVGAFYRRTFIDGYDDQDSAGARGGVYFISSSNLYFGVGAVYEAYLDCDERLGISCNNVYPEISLSFSF